MLEKSCKINNYIIDVRRHLHKIPELGYQELNTSKFIQKELNEIGVEFKTNIAKTGILGRIKKGAGPNILLRADMDGLPITEETGLEFTSTNKGFMHACGHDTHMAMLLGAIKLLKDEPFEGTLSFLFQPSEEGNYNDKDGLSGAARAIKDGVLEGVDCAISMHQVPDIPSGCIAIDNGTVMAATDIFEIIVEGKASHAGAYPEKGIDAIVIASQLIGSLQTIITREVNAQKTVVISISTINGGSAPNIVADKVVLTGTIRTLNEQVHQEVIYLINNKCAAFAMMYNTEIKFNLNNSIPATTNSKDVVSVVEKSAQKIFGVDNVLKGIVTMGGEDFGNISQTIPSCFALLGTKPIDSETYPLHNKKMTVNENALHLGVAYLAQSALDLIREYKSN